MKMHFGKHAGSDLRDVPEDYLRWVLDNLCLRRDLRSAINAELRSREGVDEDDEELCAAQDRIEELEDLVKTLERDLLNARLDRDDYRLRAAKAEKRAAFGGFSPIDASISRQIVEAGFRRLVIKNHPDVGGDARAMVALNRVIELLRAAFPDRKTVRKS